MSKTIILILGFLMLAGAILVSGYNPSKDIMKQNDAISFNNVIYEATQDGFAMRGMISTLSNDTEGIALKMFCDNKYSHQIFESTSNSDGTFAIESTCKSGDNVHVQATYDGKIYESKHLRLTRGLSHYKRSQITAASGVPEFSTMTLGIAIVLTTIGMIYLRKNG